MARGTLRIYLGPAPGVGKTYAMLDEGARRQQRGTDVVVAIVETHGRAATEAMIGNLPIIPRRHHTYRGATFDEMDLDAIIARRPQVALVDEYAHTNVPGSTNEKRWEDVEAILDAGIDVIATLNIQHLESVNDVIEEITGTPQRETVPDAVVRRANQIELVDMSPEALRRRMAHGNIYPAEKVDAALANYFRPGNLGALREIALLWTADRVEEALQQYRKVHGIGHHWETRERVVVAISGAPSDDVLIRRAARAAMRMHGDLVGVHVVSQDGLSSEGGAELDRQRRLLEELGGVYREVASPDVAEALVSATRAENASRLLLGASGRSRLQEALGGSVVNRVLRLAGGEFDVAIIGGRTASPAPQAPRRRPRALSRRRRLVGFAFAAAALPIATAALAAADGVVTLPSVLLLYLGVVVAVAAVGGLWPAICAAVVSFLLANWFFTPPVHTFTIADGDHILALSVFVGIAVAVSALVEFGARRATEGAAAKAEAEALARLAGNSPIPSLLEGLVRSFGLDGAAVLHREGEGWTIDASAGDAPSTPDQATSTLTIDATHVLACLGPPLATGDGRVAAAFAKELTGALQIRDLERGAAQAGEIERASELRTALLAAVSHDLRTPLASIRAAVTSLIETDVVWPPETVDEFLQTIDAGARHLDGLLGNLLDMSRIQTGALALTTRRVGLDEILPAALMGLGAEADNVVCDVSEALPPVVADPALLERVLANLISNAVTASPPDRNVRVVAEAIKDHVEVRVVDHGPGIAAADRERAFLPFQRLGDGRAGVGGVGLGLAVAKGFVEAMGGSIEIDNTPGGGVTMVVRLKGAL